MTSLLPDSKNGDTVSGLGYRKGLSGCRKKATRKVGDNVRGTNIKCVISAFTKKGPSGPFCMTKFPLLKINRLCWYTSAYY